MRALAACRAGDTFVVTKLDRLGRSLPAARAIADELTAHSVKLNLGGSVHDPTDPVGRLVFNVLALVAEFEAHLARMRTREGMKVAKAKGSLHSKQSKLSARQETHLVALYDAGAHTVSELEDCATWRLLPRSVSLLQRTRLRRTVSPARPAHHRTSVERLPRLRCFKA